MHMILKCKRKLNDEKTSKSGTGEMDWEGHLFSTELVSLFQKSFLGSNSKSTVENRRKKRVFS